MDKLLSLVQNEQLEKFPEWKKIIPYAEHAENQTSLSDSDIDTLIEGLALYIDMDPSSLDFGDFFDNEDIDIDDFWSPMHWAFHEGDFKFIEVMIRTPYDFNSLMFPIMSCDLGAEPKNCQSSRDCEFRYKGEDDVHAKCEYEDEYLRPDDEHFVGGNTVLHKAAHDGHTDIVKLILKFAEEKKIDINATNESGQSAICVAKRNFTMVQLLMKHCKYDREILENLGAKNLAAIILPSDDEESEEPTKKKFKRDEESDESIRVGSDESIRVVVIG